jgi:small-conductance mechanosensitive channel
MEALLIDIQDWLLHLREPQSWAQLAVVAVALGIAYLVQGRLAPRTAEHAADDALQRLARRTVERVVFPFTALIGVLAGRALLHQIGMPVKLLNIAVPLMLSMAGIRMAVFVLRKSFAPSATLKAWENIIAGTAWTVVALHLIGWLPDLLTFMDEELSFKLGATRVSLLSITQMLLWLAVLLTVALWISGLIENRLKQTEEMSPAVQVGIIKFLRFFLIALSVLIGLNAVGIDLTALTVFGGAVGVGLGFGLQRIASNFISGFILIVDRSIRPGDVITVGENFGVVKELRARYVVVSSRDGVETLIPNESLITSEVKNWSYTDRNVRIRIPVQISYENDPEQAMALMVSLARANERVLKSPEPVARMMDFADNGILLELRVWIDDPEEGTNNCRSELRVAIFKAFNAAGISFPYPHRDLYIKEMPSLLAREPEEQRLKKG